MSLFKCLVACANNAFLCIYIPICLYLNIKLYIDKSHQEENLHSNMSLFKCPRISEKRKNFTNLHSNMSLFKW